MQYYVYSTQADEVKSEIVRINDSTDNSQTSIKRSRRFSVQQKKRRNTTQHNKAQQKKKKKKKKKTKKKDDQ